MSYHVVFTRRALRDLSALPQNDRARLAKRIDGLANDPRPHGAKKLEDLEGLYRLRVGDYRVLYTIEDQVVTVTVVRVGHRRDIYR
jgi:mRNA interferase RelE/StbE